MNTPTLREAAAAALDALEEIALAGMSGTGQETEEGIRAWHARQAWKFIGIAARALDPLRAALADADRTPTQQGAACVILPDGSAFATASWPLPKDHWLYAPSPEGWDSERDCMPDLPRPILTGEHRAAVQAAIRYAVRAATLNGKEPDFDPDALVQNASVALCGFYGTATATGDQSNDTK